MSQKLSVEVNLYWTRNIPLKHSKQCFSCDTLFKYKICNTPEDVWPHPLRILTNNTLFGSRLISLGISCEWSDCWVKYKTKCWAGKPRQQSPNYSLKSLQQSQMYTETHLRKTAGFNFWELI